MKKMNLKVLKYGSNSIAMIIIVVVIAILLNAIVINYDYKIDLTSERVYSLTTNSKELLEGIDKQVEICILDDKVSNEADAVFSTLISMMDNYKSVLGDKLTVDYKEPANNPGIYDELGVSNASDAAKASMVAVVKSGNKVKSVLASELLDPQTGEYTIEGAFTGAIHYVTADKTPTIYFVTGHGEKMITNLYANMITSIEGNNYSVKTFDLMTKKSVPEDADLLIFMSPKNDITQDERDVLYKYLKSGKDMMVLMDASENKDEFTNFNRLLERYNLKINADKIYETNENFMDQNDKYTIISQITDAEANDNLVANPIWLEQARSFSLLNATRDNVETAPIMLSSPSSVAENAITGDKVEGSSAVGVTSQMRNIENRTRITLLGDTDFLSDTYRESKAAFWNVGINELLQLIDWTSEAKEEVYVGSKAIAANQLTISAGQATFVLVVTVIILPIILLAVALFVYLWRKNR